MHASTVESDHENLRAFARVTPDPRLGLVLRQPRAEIDREVDDEILGTDDRVVVRNALERPMRYICMLELDFGQDPSDPSRNIVGRGTGTLISPRHVLTAGHNLFNRFPRIRVKGKSIVRGAQRVRVAPAHDGRSRRPAPFGTVAARGWRYAGRWQQRLDMQHDFGLITLARPIAQLRDARGRRLGFWGGPGADKTRPLAEVAPRALAGRAIHISGYPGDKCLDRPRVGMATPQQIAACPAGGWASVQWRARGTVTNSAPRGGPGLLLYDLDTKGGHSGSPLWLDSGHLVAVHTGPGDFVPFEAADSSNRGVRITRKVLGSLASWRRQAPVTPAPRRSTLRRGVRGLAVFELQTRLNLWLQSRAASGRHSTPLVAVDGVFGSKTLKTVTAFQSAFRLTRDGIVGRRTWAAFDRVLPR